MALGFFATHAPGDVPRDVAGPGEEMIVTVAAGVQLQQLSAAAQPLMRHHAPVADDRALGPQAASALQSSSPNSSCQFQRSMISNSGSCATATENACGGGRGRRPFSPATRASGRPATEAVPGAARIAGSRAGCRDGGEQSRRRRAPRRGRSRPRRSARSPKTRRCSAHRAPGIGRAPVTATMQGACRRDESASARRRPRDSLPLPPEAAARCA